MSMTRFVPLMDEHTSTNAFFKLKFACKLSNPSHLLSIVLTIEKRSCEWVNRRKLWLLPFMWIKRSTQYCLYHHVSRSLLHTQSDFNVGPVKLIIPVIRIELRLKFFGLSTRAHLNEEWQEIEGWKQTECIFILFIVHVHTMHRASPLASAQFVVYKHYKQHQSQRTPSGPITSMQSLTDRQIDRQHYGP